MNIFITSKENIHFYESQCKLRFKDYKLILSEDLFSQYKSKNSLNYLKEIFENASEAIIYFPFINDSTLEAFVYNFNLSKIIMLKKNSNKNILNTSLYRFNFNLIEQWYSISSTSKELRTPSFDYSYNAKESNDNFLTIPDNFYKWSKNSELDHFYEKNHFKLLVKEINLTPLGVGFFGDKIIFNSTDLSDEIRNEISKLICAVRGIFYFDIGEAILFVNENGEITLGSVSNEFHIFMPEDIVCV